MKNENQPNRLHGSPELRDRLPRAAVTMLSEKYGKSWTWIYNVVSGKVSGNADILNDAMRLADIEDETRTKIQNAL
jgi:hypothetical protein